MYNELTSRLHSFGELLSMSIKLYTTNFVQLALIPSLIILPALAIQIFISLQTVIQVFAAIEEKRARTEGLYSNGYLLMGLVFALVSVLVEIGIMRATYLYLKGETVRLMDIVTFSVKKWPAVLVTGIILGFCVGALSILFIVPGVVFAIYWIFTFQSTVLEDKVASDAMSLSKNIIENRWLKTFGYLLVVSIVVAVIGFLFSSIASPFKPELVRNADLTSIVGVRDITPLVKTYGKIVETYRNNFAQIYLVNLITSLITLTVGHMSVVFTTVWFVNWNKFRVQKAQTVVEATK